MLGKVPQYRSTIRNYVIAFGEIFNDITIERKDSTGAVEKYIKVPLSYGPTEKFLSRLEANSSNNEVAIVLPRMSFEIIDLFYDPARQLQKNNSFSQGNNSISVRNQFYSFVPYTISFQLNIYTKVQDDALQLVEQILPYFNPQYTLTMKPFSDYPEVKEDVPISITGVSFSDDYEGTLESRRTIIYTLTFEMKLNVYGPIADRGIIRKANVNTFNAETNSQFQLLSVTPNPLDVNPDSDYGFNEFLDETDPFLDSSG